jgi:protein O-mannosyl-transferase
LLAAVIVLSIRRARQNPYLFVGWFWFLGTLIPTIGLVQVGMQSMADRYTYLPAIGLFVAMVWGLPALFDSWSKSLYALSLIGGAALLACLPVAARQLAYWRNSTSLFEHATAVTTDNYVADVCLGGAYDTAGQKDRALALFVEAVRLEPRYPQGQFDLGRSLFERGRNDEALEHLETAARLVPHDAGAQYHLGTLYLEQNNPDRAVPCFEAALRCRPDFPEAHNALGSVSLRQSQFDAAIAQFAAALRLDPGFAQAHRNWGVALSRQGKTSEALPHFAEDARLRPDDPQARFNYGFALLDNHQPAEAAVQFAEELRLAPNEPGAHFRLAQALARQRKSSEAIAHYRETLRLLPDFPDALNELAWILATNPDSGLRSGAEAVQLAQRACALTQNQQAVYLTTLSAAYAETGRLADAMATAQKALDLARAAGQTNIAARAEALLKQYRAGFPFRESD